MGSMKQVRVMGLAYDDAVAALLRPDTHDFACKGNDGRWLLCPQAPRQGTGPFLEKGGATEIHLCVNDGSGAYFQVL